MSLLVKEIEKRALGLSAVERVSLAEKLLSSLDSSLQFLFEEKWAAESEERIQAFDRGELCASEAEMVFERLQKKYGN
jgi:putative addiction module component (TIGR02574 family)